MIEINKIRFYKVFLLFFITSLVIFLNLYCVIPILLSNGLSFFSSYIILFYSPFFLMFVLTFILIKSENGKLSIKDIFERLQLRKLCKHDVFVIIILFLLCLGAYIGLSFTSKILAKIPFLTPPDFFPVEINPLKISKLSNSFMDHPMKGNIWMPITYFIGWFFNIFGEELLWRGYLLPRMVKTWGNKAWVINGSLWLLWHFFWKWNLVIIAPTAFLIPLIAQKTKNTWIGIIVHGTMNFIPVIILILGVIGMV